MASSEGRFGCTASCTLSSGTYLRIVTFLGGSRLRSRLSQCRPDRGPSAARTGYDATNSGASSFAPTNQKLVDCVAQAVRAEQVASHPVPIVSATAYASGLDPHITPASAEYQVARIARAQFG
ncbi:MAG TPA: potassium-transporting ATPase subunit C [Clostridia bacterium]|nr:potassium-transporting ATPase subunit C [Clostridia bacterium]